MQIVRPEITAQVVAQVEQRLAGGTQPTQIATELGITAHVVRLIARYRSKR